MEFKSDDISLSGVISCLKIIAVELKELKEEIKISNRIKEGEVPDRTEDGEIVGWTKHL